jgi:hypothetical protein
MTILENLNRDASLLCAHDIMDYSLLFAAELNPDYQSIATNLKLQRNASNSVVSDDSEL